MIVVTDRQPPESSPIDWSIRLLPAARHLSLLLTVCGLAVVSLNAIGAEPANSGSNLRSAFASVRAAVVRIAITDGGHSGVGTIVTKEGHILLQEVAHLEGETLIVFLPDGRRAHGILLGSSSEWNVSLAKITDEGPWPFVEMVSGQQAPSSGDSCFTVGYTLGKTGWKTSPEQRLGRISTTNLPQWFASTIQGNPIGEPYFAFGPVFDGNGKLLGNTAVESVGADSQQLHASQIQALRPQLAQPGNLDRQRLSKSAIGHETERPYVIAELKSTAVGEPSQAKQRAISCTVGLRKQGGERWSGVIISPDGWIATCGHGGQMPGDRVIVELSDGRNAAARVTGANPITDIALIKIEEPGPWPFAPLCEASDLKPDTPCWFIGFPGEREGRMPLVRITKVVHPDDSEFSRLLYTDASYSQYGGDSGGGVFDLNGRLLALNEGKETGNPGRHPRIEALRVQWNNLANITSGKVNADVSQ